MENILSNAFYSLKRISEWNNVLTDWIIWGGGENINENVSYNYVLWRNTENVGMLNFLASDISRCKHSSDFISFSNAFVFIAIVVIYPKLTAGDLSEKGEM